MAQERFAIGRTIAFVADRVEPQDDTWNAIRAQQFVGEVDDFDVGFGLAVTETLDTELMRLTVAPFLGTFVPEERADVVEPLRTARQEVVLEQRAHDRRRPLGPKRETAAPLVGERVHLFLDDVGRIADAAHEEFGSLEHRRADLAIPEATRDRVDARFKSLPAGALGGIDVCRPPRGGEFAHLVLL